MMGKKKKSSGGYASVFVSDYRHAVDNMGESEGLGSSGWVDPEDSCAPKKRCISLKTEKSVIFNIPSQVISLSELSSLEKRDLRIRLRAELEQVQRHQKKIMRKGVDEVDVAPSTTHGKEIRHPSAIRSIPQSKHKNAGMPELAKASLPAKASCNTNAMLMKQCENLLNQLMKHRFASAFNEPVDVVKLNLPDYLTVIKHPMDLGTIKSKIALGAYSSPWEFLSDVRLTFNNAMTYNPPGNYFHFMAENLIKYFEVRWKYIEKKLTPPNSVVNMGKEAPASVVPSKKLNSPLTNPTVASDTAEFGKTMMTVEEKRRLCRRLESSNGDLPEHIIDFMRQKSSNANKISEDEIEIDIDSLSDDALYELERLLDDHSVKAQQIKDKTSEIEVQNESGLSNSFMQPSRGGNDPPVSSHSPVEIERDATARSSKHATSGDLSRDSASSTYDSGASLGCESGAAKASTHVDTLKEPKSTLDQDENDITMSFDMNGPLEISDQQKQTSQLNAVPADENSREEGLSARSERHVSQEQLHRAAIMRNRFADTILKAREKILEKSDKGDPEKLRREREELERQQREEKARLLAEAKAAEDAHKRAEAAAAAEARRKRELERKAARQALLEMEKTAEINKEGQFLKDLEMLGTARTERLPSSMEETSPDHSFDDMGGFKLGGSNPLEQLGLFMKVDDEEEEEVVTVNCPGQID